MREPINKNPNKVYYIHVRPIGSDGHTSNHGGITIAYRLHENGLVYEVAYARCNIKDNFCKRVGRAIAKGNLNFDRLHLVKDTGDYKEMQQIIKQFVITHIIKTYYPGHVAKLADAPALEAVH